MQYSYIEHFMLYNMYYVAYTFGAVYSSWFSMGKEEFFRHNVREKKSLTVGENTLKIKKTQIM